MSLKHIFKIPSINIHSVDEYFALHKNEREYKGFYRVPNALPADFLTHQKEKGWRAFYAEIKQQYPLQYFIRHWLFSFDNPVYYAFKRVNWVVRDVRWAIKNFIKPCFPRWRKTLARHKFSDITHTVVESNFNLILDFYYEEVVDGIVDWNADKPHKVFYKQLVKNVEWIEKTRKLLEENLTKELFAANKDKTNKPFTAKYKKYDKIEKIIKDKESEILIWFVENRNFFWS